MAEENCPELAQLVHHLGEAINERKRLESDDFHSTEERMEVDEDMNKTLEAIREHKAQHRCELEEPSDNSQSAA